MFDEEKMTKYFEENRKNLVGKFKFQEWLTFCKEWDAACRKLRAAAGKEVQNESNVLL